MSDQGERPRDLKDRTREFALRVIKLYRALPKTAESQVIGKQILRSGTAVGANYREGTKARSKSEFAAKLNVGLMEIEETSYWLELLDGAGIIRSSNLTSLKGEASGLAAIFVTLIKRSKSRPEVGTQNAEGQGKVEIRN